MVIDNASYHNVQLEKVPSTSNRKVKMQSWLTAKSIPFSNDHFKVELLDLVKQHQHRFSGSRIDLLAKYAGHEVVRLPPYHCELNPIERVWSQVKGYVASYNTAFTLAAVEEMAREGVSRVSRENVSRACAHVIRLEEEARERNGAIDTHLESPIITLHSNSSSSSENYDISGVEKLE
ncbi:uncharacterized protein LOC144122911 [Amblyomma americanum]